MGSSMLRLWPTHHAAIDGFDRRERRASKDLITDLIEVLASCGCGSYTRPRMHDLTRATRGGAGAATLGLALAVLAITAGWLSAASYDGIVSTGSSAALAAPEAAAEPAAPTAVPTPADPDGFPFVSAQSIAVIEGSCGALLYGRDEHRKLPPASLTKLMTAAVATDQADVTTMITSTVDGPALNEATGSTIMGLTPGMTLSLLDLLYGLLLPSGNDAAIAIAEGIAGTEEKFVELMNDKARSLALDETHFTNSHGLYEDGLSSSAHDMAMLARYVMQNADLREIVKSVEWQPAWDGPPLWNGNRLISDYEGADGVKIGYTEESQQTIVASASRDGRRIIVSLMHSQDRYTDSIRLFEWSFAQPSACP
jgi:D-alanyl-D-alanine carboxypeptidase (penicillin-binding protein 5/6)